MPFDSVLGAIVLCVQLLNFEEMAVAIIIRNRIFLCSFRKNAIILDELWLAVEFTASDDRVLAGDRPRRDES